MKSSSKKNKILIVVIGVLFILSLNFFQKEVRGFFYSISSPIQKNLWKTGDSLSGFFGGVFKEKNLTKENEELKFRNQELIAEIVSLKESEKENKVLREALEIGLQKEFKLTLAEVISKDFNQDAILVNQGSKDGILSGMPAITQEKVLLGKVSEVYENFSRIILISNKESSFDAQIPDRDIAGVVKGKGSLKVYFDLIPRDKELKNGDLVLSTSLGGIYPKGLLVGLIKKAEPSDIKPFYEAEISSFFNIRELKNIFLILDF